MNIQSQPPAAFYRDLAVLIGEGCTLKESIDVMIESSENLQVRRFAAALSSAGARDDSPQALLGACPFCFDFVAKEAILHANDTATMVAVLFAVADGVETETTFSKRVLLSLAYPSAIFLFYLALFSVVQMFVLPVFEEMFASFGTELPTSTVWVLGSANYLPLGGLLLIAWFIKPIRVWALRRLPLFRAIYRNANTMKVTRACLLLRQCAADGDQDRALTCALQAFGMAAGEQHDAFVQQQKLFSPLVWRAIRHPSNPSRDLLLSDLLNSLEHRHRHLVDRAAVLSQVVSMLLIASLVASLAYSVMAPIFQLSSVVH